MRLFVLGSLHLASVQSQMLTQKCYPLALQQLGENTNIPKFLMMFKCAQSKVTVKLDDTFLLFHLTT